jgi:hypothetical protein
MRNFILVTRLLSFPGQASCPFLTHAPAFRASPTLGGVDVTFVWKYADSTIERDPVPTDAASLGFALEVRHEDPLVVKMNGRHWVVAEVNPGPDEGTREVVMNEHV